MIVIDNGFLTSRVGKYDIGQDLPLRMQKRELLKALGFSGDPMLKRCMSCESDKVMKLFDEYCAEGYPFLIVVSEKPVLTLIPPLFIVKDTDTIQWRNDQNQKKIISAAKTLSIIKKYSIHTWVEFCPNPWKEDTIAGRLIYSHGEHQILEMQEGTVPTKLIDDHQLLTYMGKLSFLDIEKNTYLDDSRYLRESEYSRIYPLSQVRRICRGMPEIPSFEALSSISRLPTVEFAFTKASGLLVVDVDWPAQYVNKK